MAVMTLRKLPLGHHYPPYLGGLRGLGQDDGDDLAALDNSTMNLTAPDFSDLDLSGNYATPTFDMSTVDVGAAPAISLPSSVISPVVGPAAPGEIPNISQIVGPTGNVTDLNSLILTGAIAPPAGSGLTSDQAATLAANGATSNDIADILNGNATYQGTLNKLIAGSVYGTAVIGQPTNAGGTMQTNKGPATVPATTGVAQALTSLVSRPTPSTVQTGASGAGGTSVATALNWLSAATLIPGVPNGVLFLGGALAIAALGAFAGRR